MRCARTLQGSPASPDILPSGLARISSRVAWRGYPRERPGKNNIPSGLARMGEDILGSGLARISSRSAWRGYPRERPGVDRREYPPERPGEDILGSGLARISSGAAWRGYPPERPGEDMREYPRERPGEDIFVSLAVSAPAYRLLRPGSGALRAAPSASGGLGAEG